MLSWVRLIRRTCDASTGWWLFLSTAGICLCETCNFCCGADNCWLCWLSVVPLYFVLFSKSISLCILRSGNQLCEENYFFPSAIVVIFSESWVDVMLPTDVISVTSVVLGISRRTIGTESSERFNNGSDSLLLPSIHERASGPNFRTNAWMPKTIESINRISHRESRR